MRRARVLLWRHNFASMAVGYAVVACGGDEFASSAAEAHAASGGAGAATSGGSGGLGGKGGSGAAGSGGIGASGGSGGATGGSSSGGSGGGSGSGGAGGSGGSGVSVDAGNACTPGALECDAEPPRRCTDAGQWQTTTCGPLHIADITDLDAAGLPGFNAPGFRCKALSVCSIGQSCIYYDQHLGSLQSSETTFTDGVSLLDPQAVFVRIYGGAASQCGDPAFTLTAGESLVVLHDGTQHSVLFPATTSTSLTLYVREDGATFYDAALTQPAQLPQ